MEILPRLTRRMAHKLLKEKSVPNRLQRFITGGFKRKADFLTLAHNKRRKTGHQKSSKGVFPSGDVKSAEEEPAEENVGVENGKPSCSDSGSDGSFFCNGGIKIVVDLPVIGHALSPETFRVVSEFSKFEDPEKDNGGLRSSSSEEDCKNGYGDFQAFRLKLAYDTDSEEHSSWNLGDNAFCEGKVNKDNQEVVTSKPTEFLEGDTVQTDIALVERGAKDVEAGKEEGSFIMAVKEGSEMEDGGLGLVCKKKQVLLKRDRLRRLGPGSRWLYSGSRFASFLRSEFGGIEIGDLENLMQNGRKGASKLDTPPKQQMARMPGKRKVTLSPNSQLKLLEASKSSSYRRMLPFCNELAKNLAKASSAQSITKMSSREDFIAQKECDMHHDEGLSKGFLPLEHIQSDNNVTQSALVTIDEDMSGEPKSIANVELEQNRVQKEYLSASMESQYTGHVEIAQNDSQTEVSSAGEDMRMEPLCIEHANLGENEMLKEPLPTKCVQLEENTNQTESVISNDPDSTNLPTVHVKLEEDASQSKSAHNDQFLSQKSLFIEHTQANENESCIELQPNNAEMLKEPLSTKCVKLEENMNQAELAISNGLDSTDLPAVHVKLEEASQSKSVHNDQFLSRKSLFVEHVQPKQNELQTEKAINDHSLPKESLSSECAKSEQAECQAESPSIQADSSTACYPNDSTDLGINGVSELSSNALLRFSSEQCVSPTPMYKSLAIESDSMVLVDHKSPLPSLPGAANSTYYPTHVEDPSPLHTPASVPSKGILKMSPCPCRGVCMCSDCISFRLQAERASEFSERQLREVEVLAVTLLKELANARNVMEKSLIAKPGGVGFPYSISTTAVKEATKSALRAEETARSQLVQMTRDCNLHCKILRMQQRRVKFADKIEVKLFKS